MNYKTKDKIKDGIKMFLTIIGCIIVAVIFIALGEDESELSLILLIICVPFILLIFVLYGLAFLQFFGAIYEGIKSYGEKSKSSLKK